MAYKGFDLTGKVALVTGGNGGIGLGMADAMAEAGADICIWGTRKEKNDAAVAQLKKHGRKVHAQIVDVGDEKQVADAFAETVKVMGHVDNCVANAGVSGRGKGSILEMEYEEWRRVLRVNLDGVFNTCKAVIDGMCERGFGRIVNISSVNGQTGQFGQTNYSAAKAGMHGFTMALAREVARKGVTVNSVSPGYCETALVAAIPDDIRQGIVDKVPVGRLGQPSEIARTVAFLTADDAGYITGANIPVNGGLYMGF